MGNPSVVHKKAHSNLDNIPVTTILGTTSGRQNEKKKNENASHGSDRDYTLRPSSNP